MKKVVVLLVAALLILHQDFWWWDSIDPLVFGFVPIGLAYHVGVSLVAGIVWFLAMKYCWPAGTEVADHEAAAARQIKGEL